jgi:uncharacterized membrane protein YhaH (DUF805 family)
MRFFFSISDSDDAGRTMRRSFILAFALFAIYFLIAITVIAAIIGEWIFIPAGVGFVVVVAASTAMVYRRFKPPSGE